MALPGVVRVQVPMEAVFPHGALCLGVEPELDFDRRDEEDNQKRDPDSHERVWVVRVVDLDPEALKFGGSAEVKVRITAPHQPVPPQRKDAVPPLVEFEDLTMAPYVNGKRCRGVKDPQKGCGCRVGFSLRAAGMRAAGALSAGSGNGSATPVKAGSAKS